MLTGSCVRWGTTPREHLQFNASTSGLPRVSPLTRVKTKEISGWKSGQETKRQAERMVGINLRCFRAFYQRGPIIQWARAKVDLHIRIGPRLSIPGAGPMVYRDIELFIANQFCHDSLMGFPSGIER